MRADANTANTAPPLQGVIPLAPDAWVWLGDMFYADEPAFDCSQQNLNASQCQCAPDWLREPPYMCMVGLGAVLWRGRPAAARASVALSGCFKGAPWYASLPAW